jgi:hypothetical protein
MDESQRPLLQLEPSEAYPPPTAPDAGPALAAVEQNPGSSGAGIGFELVESTVPPPPLTEDAIPQPQDTPTPK